MRLPNQFSQVQISLPWGTRRYSEHSVGTSVTLTIQARKPQALFPSLSLLLSDRHLFTQIDSMSWVIGRMKKKFEILYLFQNGDLSLSSWTEYFAFS